MANQFVAFMDERHGLGAWVAEQIAADLFRNPADAPRASHATKQRAADEASAELAGRPVSSADLSMSLLASGSRRSFGAAPVAEAPAPTSSGATFKTWTSPRASAEATAAAVVSGQAQVGVLPLYEEHGGFNPDTLSALIDFPQEVLGEYVAESNYVLAVPTDLIHEVDQAGFTDSFDAAGGRAFAWTADKQRKYRGRVGTVLASADAMRHCAAAIEGLRARGVEVQQLPDGADAYRAGLERAQARLDPSREVATTYGPQGQQRVSKTKAGNHAKPLLGVLMAFDKALGNGHYSFDSDYVVLEAEMAGADRVRTSFIATTQAPKGRTRQLDAVSSDLASVERYFHSRSKGRRRDEHGPLRHAPGLSDRAADPHRQPQPFPFARILYAVPTVGRDARDHSQVLAKLAEQGLSYRTQPLDRRDGMPVVIAIDVPNGEMGKLRPVVRAVRKLPGAQRLAAFPSVTPMVAADMRPAPAASAGWRLVRQGAMVIGVLLAGFVAASLAGLI